MNTFTVKFYSHIGGLGIHSATVQSSASTARELLHDLQNRRAIPLTTNIVKAARNDSFIEWDDPVSDGDVITLLPPFSGG